MFNTLLRNSYLFSKESVAMVLYYIYWIGRVDITVKIFNNMVALDTHQLFRFAELPCACADRPVLAQACLFVCFFGLWARMLIHPWGQRTSREHTGFDNRAK